jgi:hypothetical protein
MIDARNQEVLVSVRDPEQLVAHGAADDVRVETERANVAADSSGHGGDSCLNAGATRGQDES